MSPRIHGSWGMRTMFQEMRSVSAATPATIFVPIGSRAIVYAVGARPPAGMTYPVPRGEATAGVVEIWDGARNSVVVRCPLVSLYDQYLGWPAETDRLVAMLVANFDLNREARTSYAASTPWPKRGFSLPAPPIFDPSSGITIKREGGDGMVDVLIEGYYQEYVPNPRM